MQEATGQLAKKETPESIPTPSQPVEETQAEQGIPVKVAEVEQRDINLFQTFYGTAVPYAEANVQGNYGGKIVFLKVKEGDDVKKGEIIVRFDDSDTQLQLQQAIANKNSALLENTLSDFKIAAPISGVIDEKHYNLNEVYRKEKTHAIS